MLDVVFMQPPQGHCYAAAMDDAPPRVPRLADPKHEAFAQAIANNHSPKQAYLMAGYTGSGGSPAKSPARNGQRLLRRHIEIQARVAWLRHVTSRSALESIQITKEWVLSQMKETFYESFEKGNYEVARKCLENLGTDVGLFQKHSHQHIYEETAFEGMDDIQLQEWIIGKAVELISDNKNHPMLKAMLDGNPVIELASGAAAEAGGKPPTNGADSASAVQAVPEATPVS